MLGPRSSCKRTRTSWPNGAALSGPARAGRGSAIEDWLAALNSAAGSRRRRHRSDIGRFVNWPRSGLRHHHAARRRCGWYPDMSALARRADWRARRLCGNGGNRCCNFRRGCRNLRGRLRSCCRFECGCRRRRLRNRCRLGNYRLLFAHSRSHGRSYGASRRRRNDDHRARRRHHACRWFGHDSAGRGTAGNSRRSSGLSNNRRRLSRQRNYLARLRTRGSRGGNRGRGGRWALRGLGWLRRRSGRLGRHAHVTRLIFLFLLLGQNGLHHIAGLGDVRQVDFGNDGGRAVTVRRTCGMRSRSRFLRKMRTNPIRLVAFERTGVRFARRNTELRKNVENRARLYFQLFCEIVNTNLAHPPLFNSVPPNRP